MDSTASGTKEHNIILSCELQTQQTIVQALGDHTVNKRELSGARLHISLKVRAST